VYEQKRINLPSNLHQNYIRICVVFDAEFLKKKGAKRDAKRNTERDAI